MEPIVTKLITSAAAISALTFLTRFFGNIISDQRPYCDDRKWDAELSGAFFLLSFVIVPGVIGGAIGAYYGFESTTLIHFVYLIIVGLMQMPFLFSNQALYKKLYGESMIAKADDAKIEKPEWLADWQKTVEEIQVFSIWITKHIPAGLLSIPLSYVLIREYLGGNIVWFTVIAAGVFHGFVLEAIFYSMTKYNKFPRADVYLVDVDEPIRDIELLRYNADNVKFRQNGEAVVINKSRIVKIVFTKADQKENG